MKIIAWGFGVYYIKDYVIFHELPNADEGHIQRMDFSASGNLYVYVQTKTKEILYKIPVMRDFTMNEIKL